MTRHVLQPHALTPCAAVEAVVVELERASADLLEVRWRIVGDIAALRVPVEALDPERLWEHTCVELFAAPAVGEGYVEWNVSPTGQVATFAFSSYRVRTPAPSASAAVDVDVQPRALRLTARVPILDAARLSLTAVIEDADGALSYWAVHHPCARADFHHRDGFVVELP